MKKCNECGQVYDDNVDICNCGELLPLVVTPERLDEEEIQQGYPIHRESIFKKILKRVGFGGIMGGGCLFSIIQLLFTVGAGSLMIWSAIKLFSEGSIIWGLVVLFIGTPIAVGLAGFFFIYVLALAILALIILGISHLFGFDISFSNAWDIVWFSVKTLILGGLAFSVIAGFISAIRENRILGFFKEYWWYILLLCFFFWLLFVRPYHKDKTITYDGREYRVDDWENTLALEFQAIVGMLNASCEKDIPHVKALLPEAINITRLRIESFPADKKDLLRKGTELYIKYCVSVYDDLVIWFDQVILNAKTSVKFTQSTKTLEYYEELASYKEFKEAAVFASKALDMVFDFDAQYDRPAEREDQEKAKEAMVMLGEFCTNQMCRIYKLLFKEELVLDK